MKNRAKCKLCGDIIESFHRHDYVHCKCGEIAVDGGSSYFKCSAINWENFLRIDDEGNEIVPSIVESTDDKILEWAKEKLKEPAEFEAKDSATRQHLAAIDDMIAAIERLPDRAMSDPVTHYDLYALLVLIRVILLEKA
jgi:hypothetical protein